MHDTVENDCVCTVITKAGKGGAQKDYTLITDYMGWGGGRGKKARLYK